MELWARSMPKTHASTFAFPRETAPQFSASLPSTPDKSGYRTSGFRSIQLSGLRVCQVVAGQRPRELSLRDSPL
jgi:hypothetical protein